MPELVHTPLEEIEKVIDTVYSHQSIINTHGVDVDPC